MQLSIIIPVLNDAGSLYTLLGVLAQMRQRGVEIIVVDGGSADESAATAQARADKVLIASRGRASQQHAGAQAAQGQTLWFLHADCVPPKDADVLIAAQIASGARWGRFDVRIAGKSAWLPIVAWCMNHRSRLSGICTGDQGIFVDRATYIAAGGMPQIPLMEDIALSKLLKRERHPARIAQPITTSGRRWDTHGALRTIMTMWILRLRYFLGEDPAHLHRIYYSTQTVSQER
jgi:rSAM/selenodomain-associated transferase 2